MLQLQAKSQAIPKSTILYMDGKASEAILQKTLDSLLRTTDCSKEFMVSDKAFNTITAGFLTAVAPGPNGQLKNGTSANLKLSDDKLSADLQAAFLIGNKTILNFGFNGDVTNNISTVYYGKNGFGSAWGVKLGVSYRFSQTLLYESRQECYNFQVSKADFLKKQYDNLSKYTALNYANMTRDSLKALLVQYVDAYKRSSFANPYDSGRVKVIGDTIKIIRDQLDMLWELYDLSKDGNQLKKNYIFELMEDSLTDYEVKNSNWKGYSIWLFNLNSFLNQKPFTSYNPSPITYADRFNDFSFTNWGGTLGFSFFGYNARFSQNANIDFGIQRQGNYELPENKKFKNDFITDSVLVTGSGNTSYVSNKQTAFDSSRLPFKDYMVVSLSGQYTILFGKNKNFGGNITGYWAYSNSYEVKNRVELFVGPVISLPNKENDGSAINFALLAGYKNIADKTLTAKEKFSVQFNVSVPFKIIQLAKK
ncbi:hypothetical protein [Chitinophaga sp. CB10]|uniref:hypothetical protein n=1 Tax=Chitinophaga sp. CB10 TaxID=1891659 RepID=UPI0025BA6D98|nr:hypothetical protein [Chitinophaga sp. CB10]